MNKEEFWKTIESVNHSVPDGNHEMVAKQMCEELLHYSPQDILDWHLILREYTNAAYRNDLWAACTALGAHSSDDGFIDFRTWLISQGKDIYMDAMRDPDTLAANPHAGNEMNFEAFSACAIDAYERKLNLTGMDRYTKPYDDLDKHALSDQLVMDIQSEIPQHPDAPSIHLPRNYSVQFPRIWARMSDQPSEASPAPPNPDRSAHRIFKINDLLASRSICSLVWSYTPLEILWAKRCQVLPLFWMRSATNQMVMKNMLSLPCPLASLSAPKTVHISIPTTAILPSSF